METKKKTNHIEHMKTIDLSDEPSILSGYGILLDMYDVLISIQIRFIVLILRDLLILNTIEFSFLVYLNVITFTLYLFQFTEVLWKVKVGYVQH